MSHKNANKPFRCLQCNRTFKIKRALSRHKNKCRDKETFQCETCQKVLGSKQGLLAHTKRHLKLYDVKCEFCDKGFFCAGSLKLHINSRHSGKSKFVCHVCKRPCYDKTALKNHIEKHSNSYVNRSKVKCEECHQEFLDEKYLKIHQKKKHVMDNRFVCDVCGKRLYSKSGLTDHVNIHKGLKPHKCDSCGVGFANSTTLRLHNRRHTGEKPYKCTICVKAFTQSHSLKVHLRMHTGDKPFKCSICGKGFVSTSVCKAHMKCNHKLELPLLTQFEIKKEPKSKKNNNVEDNNFKEEPREENDYYIDPSIYSSLNIQLGEELRALDWPGATAYQGILTLDQLPQKSKLKYEKAYCGFMNWLKESQFPAITEDALVTYFTEKSQVFKSSTLWSLFSMIKATMIVQDNIDMGEYKRLLALLKCKNKGYVANKSKVFTKEQLQQFLKEAPDKTYLMMKVALILGISGGLRRDELSQLGIDEIEDLGAALVVKIPDSKSSNLHRTFTVIPEQADELDCLDIYRKYLSLRPKNVRHRRFFVTYRGGKCTPQVVGVNTFGKIPKLVAKYLDLPQLERYNGHSFKKSSVSLTKTDRFF